jgi:hypothetical protein
MQRSLSLFWLGSMQLSVTEGLHRWMPAKTATNQHHCLRQKDSVTKDLNLAHLIELKRHEAGMLTSTSSSRNWSLFTVSDTIQEPATGFYVGPLNPLHILTNLFQCCAPVCA